LWAILDTRKVNKGLTTRVTRELAECFYYSTEMLKIVKSKLNLKTNSNEKTINCTIYTAVNDCILLQ
jgi:hypothetical protein